MTLAELQNHFFRSPLSTDRKMIYVFNNDDDAEAWEKSKYTEEETSGYFLVCAITTDYRFDHVVKDEICNAEIDNFFAVDRNTIAVVLMDEDEW